MALVLLFIALAAAAAAAVLWRVANKQEAQYAAARYAEAQNAELQNAEPQEAMANPAPIEPSEVPSAEEPTEEPAVEPTQAPVEEPADLDAAEPTSEPAPEPEPESALAPTPEPEPDGTPDDIDDASNQDTSANDSSAQPLKHRALIPGAMRRERKQWAQRNGYEFSKHDSYLADEFSRGAAASGIAPKDIVAGNAFGHEMLLMDIGGINVMAMRTGAAADTVVDFRRAGVEVTHDSEDLLPVGDYCGFRAFATDVAVAQRMVDVRVETALSALPQEVTAVWMESEWVLAQTTKYARAQQWDDMLAPLGLLADASRVLPPRPQPHQQLRLADLDPSRIMSDKATRAQSGASLLTPVGTPPGAGSTGAGHPGTANGGAATGGAGSDGAGTVVGLPVPMARPASGLEAEAESQDIAPVQRPDQPVVLPSRTLSEARGVVEHRAVGGDEVDAIATGRHRADGTGASSHLARVPRRLDGNSAIFNDSPE